MKSNKMEQVAELLGVEIGRTFNIKGRSLGNPYTLTNKGLYSYDGIACSRILIELISGESEIEQPILDDVEKRYLEAVLRPFKDRVQFVEKKDDGIGVFIKIGLKRYDDNHCIEHLDLPYFQRGTMYNGMEYNKRYTLKKLLLFKD